MSASVADTWKSFKRNTFALSSPIKPGLLAPTKLSLKPGLLALTLAPIKLS